MTIESRALVSDAFAKIDQSGTPHTPLPRFDNRKQSDEDSGDMISDAPRTGDREGAENAPSTRVCKLISYTLSPDGSEESQAASLIVSVLGYSAWCNKYEVPIKQSPEANASVPFVIRHPAERSAVGVLTAGPVSLLGWEFHMLAELARSQNVRPMADVRTLFGTWPSEENDGLETATAQKALVEDRERERLANRLWMAFAADPLEDGMFHPAEEIIGEALRSTGDNLVLDWFWTFSLDAERPSFAASVLRCLGRQTPPGTDLWRTELVRDGLSMDDVEIRDAAVQAAESWGDRSLVDVMRAHREAEPWLREYIEDVISDLGD